LIAMVLPNPRSWLVMALVSALAACSTGPDKPTPAELPPAAALMGTRLIWSVQMGATDGALAPRAAGDRIFVAGSGGTVAVLDAENGRDIWRVNLNTPLAAGVGADGETAAVVTRGNELVALAGGKEIWRVRLTASAFTTPLVAGRRVFVHTADRSVSAFDGQTGARLWSQSRTGEPLVLRQPGALLAVGDTLVAGLSGRLVGLNPTNGSVRWEAPIANPRGTNEVERLVDVVGPVSRVGNSVCARGFASAVGCIDASRGNVVWTKPAAGSEGLGGDERLVFGTESDGQVRAWQRATGDTAWTQDRLKHRLLTAPLSLGRVVAIGDGTGVLHLLSREDGTEMTRLTTDGSALIGAPIIAGQSLVVQTLKGGVYAWRPQ
jgi:outer membrane assembly lipoprotein YfgL